MSALPRPLVDAVRRHPVTAHIALTFAISWGGIVAAFGLGPIAPEQIETRGAFLYVALLLGPSLAGLLLLGIDAGKVGFADFGRRLLRWKVDPRWYLLALGAAPLTLAMVLGSLSLVPGLVPDVFSTEGLGGRVGTGVAAGLAVALCEETGWTGFVTPRLRRRHSVLATGAILGFVWGVWHFPPFWEADTFVRPMAFGLLLVRLLSWLPAFRVLLVWVHERTESLLIVIVMHASLVASQFVFVAPYEFTTTAASLYIVVWAVLLWAVAAVVTRRLRGGRRRVAPTAAATNGCGPTKRGSGPRRSRRSRPRGLANRRGRARRQRPRTARARAAAARDQAPARARTRTDSDRRGPRRRPTRP